MSKYINSEKFRNVLQKEVDYWKEKAAEHYSVESESRWSEAKHILDLFDSLLQEETNRPSIRTRVIYAICKLQSFKPLREAIVLDDYVYDESKCYRENLVNYIHAIPENRLTEIRHYLKEKGWWPYDDDADWMVQEQPEVDLEKVEKASYKVFPAKKKLSIEKIKYPNREDENFSKREIWKDGVIWAIYNLGINARKKE